MDCNFIVDLDDLREENTYQELETHMNLLREYDIEYIHELNNVYEGYTDEKIDISTLPNYNDIMNIVENAILYKKDAHSFFFINDKKYTIIHNENMSTRFGNIIKSIFHSIGLFCIYPMSEIDIQTRRKYKLET